jgi:hypothetical protein
VVNDEIAAFHYSAALQEKGNDYPTFYQLANISPAKMAISWAAYNPSVLLTMLLAYAIMQCILAKS